MCEKSEMNPRACFRALALIAVSASLWVPCRAGPQMVLMTTDACEAGESERLTIEVTECDKSILVAITATHSIPDGETPGGGHLVEAYFAMPRSSQLADGTCRGNASGQVWVRTQSPNKGYPATARFFMDVDKGSMVDGRVLVAARRSNDALTSWLDSGAHWTFLEVPLTVVPLDRGAAEFILPKITDKVLADALRGCLGKCRP